MGLCWLGSWIGMACKAATKLRANNSAVCLLLGHGACCSHCAQAMDSLLGLVPGACSGIIR